MSPFRHGVHLLTSHLGDDDGSGRGRLPSIFCDGHVCAHNIANNIVCVRVCVCRGEWHGWVRTTVRAAVNGIYRVEFQRVEKVIRASCQMAASL